MADLLVVTAVHALSGQSSGIRISSELSTDKLAAGAALAVLRATKGLSQQELATEVGCDVRSIRRAERGDAGYATFSRIAFVLTRVAVVDRDGERASHVLGAAAIALAPLLGAKSEWAVGPDRRTSRPASRLRRHMARLANAHFGVSLEKIAGVYGCRRQSVAEQVQAAEAEIADDDDLAERIADLFALIEATVRRVSR